MKKRQLPIGVQSFVRMIEDDLLYIDKTETIYQLAKNNGSFFLSRPRRFGKSLLLSTLKALFQGKKTLFQDLWIAEQWNWEQTHPIIHISFNNIGYQNLGLEEAIQQELLLIAQQYHITLEWKGIIRQFRELIVKLAQKNKVVILIDEYDKPIIDYLSPEQLEKAEQHRNILKGFYSVIKDSDQQIRFFFITGISKFSKVSIFSDLNNLRDISFDWQFSTICGYTQAELDHYFQAYRPLALQRNNCTDEELSVKIRDWYNGYTWDLDQYVYNPFSILNFFARGDFENFWFETGTPTFLINLLKERFYYDFGEAKAGNIAFLSYDIKTLETLPLLFQTGYLSLKSKHRQIYKMGYPNKEVKQSMLQHLIGAFRHAEASRSGVIAYEIEEALYNRDIDAFILQLNSLFASIPYQIFDAHKEKYYHALIHLLFNYVGISMESEVNTSRGRTDVVIHTPQYIYILEFKLNQSAASAIQQIRDRGYVERYQGQAKEVIGLGINFDSATKQVGEWEEVNL